MARLLDWLVGGSETEVADEESGIAKCRVQAQLA